MEKQCRDCEEVKPLDQFGSIGGRQSHLKRTYCKKCASERTKKYRGTSHGREVNRAACRRWGQRNTQQKVQAVRERRQGLENRTPKWLTVDHKKQMRDFYWLAKDLRAISGQEYHVDHIVPLCGKDISGLNVPWNLQVLPADINIAKSNNWS